jgi:hypothetical protein
MMLDWMRMNDPHCVFPDSQLSKLKNFENQFSKALKVHAAAQIPQMQTVLACWEPVFKSKKKWSAFLPISTLGGSRSTQAMN